MKTEVKDFLADHPKVVTALFTLMILLSQVASVVASGEGSGGP